MVTDDLFWFHLAQFIGDFTFFMIYIFIVETVIHRSLSLPISHLNEEIKSGGKKLKENKAKLGDN